MEFIFLVFSSDSKNFFLHNNNKSKSKSFTITQMQSFHLLCFILLSTSSLVFAGISLSCAMSVIKVVSPTYDLNTVIQKDPLDLNKVMLCFNKLMDAMKSPNYACSLNQDVSQINITPTLLANQTCKNTVISVRPNFKELAHQMNLLNLSYFQDKGTSILAMFSKFRQTCKAN